MIWLKVCLCTYVVMCKDPDVSSYGIIDNMCHYGYETNKRHLNQASFVPPTKFVNIFVNICVRTNELCIRHTKLGWNHRF